MRYLAPGTCETEVTYKCYDSEGEQCSLFFDRMDHLWIITLIFAVEALINDPGECEGCSPWLLKLNSMTHFHIRYQNFNVITERMALKWDFYLLTCCMFRVLLDIHSFVHAVGVNEKLNYMILFSLCIRDND